MDRAAYEAACAVVLVAGQPRSSPAATNIVDFLEHPPTSEADPGVPVPAAHRPAGEAHRRRGERPAVGIGTTMLLHCDYVVCGRERAVLGAVREPGPVPRGGSSLMLPCDRLQARREMLLFGERVDRRTAHAGGS
jgi:hypothetical protein